MLDAEIIDNDLDLSYRSSPLPSHLMHYLVSTIGSL
jgi:hypothetical protein